MGCINNLILDDPGISMTNCPFSLPIALYRGRIVRSDQKRLRGEKASVSFLLIRISVIAAVLTGQFFFKYAIFPYAATFKKISMGIYQCMQAYSYLLADTQFVL